MEASKFTEIGYVGRDVDSMIRDLLETSIRMVKQEKLEEVEDKAKAMAEERIVDYILPLPQKKKRIPNNPLELFLGSAANSSETFEEDEPRRRQIQQQREILKQKVNRLEMEDEIIEIEVGEKSSFMEYFRTGWEERVSIFRICWQYAAKKRREKLSIAEA